VIICSAKPVVHAYVRAGPDSLPAKKIVGKQNKPLYFSGDYAEPFGGIDSVRWIFPDTTFIITQYSTASIQHSFKDTGMFYPKLRAKDRAGNIAIDSVKVTIDAIINKPPYFTDSAASMTATAQVGKKYRCIVGNGAGFDTNNNAELTVGIAPFITAEPISDTVADG
jgi:hypothetical protein